MRVRDQAVNEPGRITSPLATGYDRYTVGRRSERVSRFLGTRRYLAIQTPVVIAWIALNVTLTATDRWDKYPFILLA